MALPPGWTRLPTHNGVLEHSGGSALSFGVEATDGPWTDYRWYQVHEGRGKEITLVFSENDTQDPNTAHVGFVVLKR